MPWARPLHPTTDPALTREPLLTAIPERYEYDERRSPPWSTVTLSRPATGPAKVTMPDEAATTGVPNSAARSMPQCPA
jgi:hypothetical protein